MWIYVISRQSIHIKGMCSTPFVAFTREQDAIDWINENSDDTTISKLTYTKIYCLNEI